MTKVVRDLYGDPTEGHPQSYARYDLSQCRP